MTKGLTWEEATGMLVRGFMEVRIEELPEQLRRQIEVAMDLAGL